MSAVPDDIMLEVRDLRKSYGSVEVLHGVSLRIRGGEAVGLIGENGAGKSTLAKCINGLTGFSGGALCLDGRQLHRQDVFSAQASGIITIPQEFDLENDLTVAENIFLGREPANAFGIIRRRQMAAQAADYLGQLSCSISTGAMVRDLGVAEKQFVEIAKALSRHCRLLILDEPTTVLNREEVERLFAVLRRLKENGTALLFISHKLHEVLELCDRVAVLRDGVMVHDSPLSGLTAQNLAELMVGRQLSSLYPPLHHPDPSSPVLLQVQDLSSGKAVRGVSFSLRRGEILGFAGLVGAGRTELAECLYGIRRLDGGRMVFDGRDCAFRSPAEAVAAGISYLSEDRQGTGLIGGFSVAGNITLVSLARYCHPFISRRQLSRCAAEYIRRFRIKTRSPDTPICDLSGGNQQKAAIARGLDTRPKLFIFDEPTRGIDVNAKSEVYAFIHGLLEEGIACIMISSDLEEVIGMCPRIAVMHEGRLAGILEGADRTEEKIMYLATNV